jgi:hypothetical protein
MRFEKVAMQMRHSCFRSAFQAGIIFSQEKSFHSEKFIEKGLDCEKNFQ